MSAPATSHEAPAPGPGRDRPGDPTGTTGPAARGAGATGPSAPSGPSGPSGPSAPSGPGSVEAADAERLRRLRRMKGLALGLLVLAAVVYLSTLGRTGFWGFVNAGAEASMVGAMADWFAVTALFRHPLGLPVPHTALVPRKKDEFGHSLQEFFAENFLQEAVVRERLGAAQVVHRVARWTGREDHARRVVAEVAAVLSTAVQRLREQDVRGVVEDVLIPRFKSEPVAPLAGGLLQEVVADGAHHGLVDLALDEAHRWLRDHQDDFTEVISERAPWWTPDRLNEVVTQRLYVEAVRWVRDIRDDPDHHARQALDSLLAQLAEDLLTDPATQERAEKLKLRVLDQPQVVATGMSLWEALRRALVAALDDESGPLREKAVTELVAFAGRVDQDPALRERLEGFVSDGVVWAVGRYGTELTQVITATIERWDGQEASRKIELHVGRDLQFIRINGTIVGGLVGLVIHAVSLAVQH